MTSAIRAVVTFPPNVPFNPEINPTGSIRPLLCVPSSSFTVLFLLTDQIDSTLCLTLFICSHVSIDFEKEHNGVECVRSGHSLLFVSVI